LTSIELAQLPITFSNRYSSKKELVKFNGRTSYGRLASDAIERLRCHLEDGFSLCKPKDLDYHPNYDHPISIGNQKISNGVKNFIKQDWHIK